MSNKKITPEIARQALSEMTDMIADDNYFAVDAALTAWEAQQEIVDSQVKEIEKRHMIHEDYRRTALERIAYQESEINNQRKYIGFLQSCVRSGEKWEGNIDDFIKRLSGE